MAGNGKSADEHNQATAPEPARLGASCTNAASDAARNRTRGTDSTATNTRIPSGLGIPRLVSLLILANAVLMATAALVYPERFRFWEYPLSELGAYRTMNGTQNGPSQFFFIVDMVLSGLVMALIAHRFRHRRGCPNRLLRTVLASVGAFGFWIAVLPYDLYLVNHSLGSAFVFFSLWALSVSYLAEVRTRGETGVFLLGHGVLQTTVISYAVTFLVNVPAKQAAQKLAVFGLMLIVRVLCAQNGNGDAGEAVNPAENDAAELGVIADCRRPNGGK